MQNASRVFGFLTRNSSLGELCILHIQKRQEMLFRGIVTKYVAELILLTIFKKTIGMKEKFVQNMEVPVSLMEFLLQTRGSFGGFFLFDIFHFTMVFRGIGLSKLSRLVSRCDKNRNSNVFLRMCFRMFFRECVSNLLLVTF